MAKHWILDKDYGENNEKEFIKILDEQIRKGKIIAEQEKRKQEERQRKAEKGLKVLRYYKG